MPKKQYFCERKTFPNYNKRVYYGKKDNKNIGKRRT